ncbi:MAG: YggT family protein [Spiroplasma sp.]|nr:YggT family protein [Mycoplasmatales bacterium]
MSWVPELRHREIYRSLGNIVGPYLSLFRSSYLIIGQVDISVIVALLIINYAKIILITIR